jgi:FAD/FMN-containing dehydrogenase
MCLAGLLAFPIEQTPRVARSLEEYNQDIPNALSTSFAFLTTPEGRRAIGLGFVHADPGPDTEQEVVQPMRGFGTELLMDFCGPMPYLAVQRMLDENTSVGWRYYPRSFGMDKLHEGAMEILAEGFATNPSDRSLVGGGLMGGAMAELDATATAFPHRTGHLVSILSAWTDPAEDETNAAWTEQMYDKLVPYTNGGVYVSHLGTDSRQRTVDAYGPNWERLRDLKARYDPANLFRHTHNIPPAG